MKSLIQTDYRAASIFRSPSGTVAIADDRITVISAMQNTAMFSYGGKKTRKISSEPNRNTIVHQIYHYARKSATCF